MLKRLLSPAGFLLVLLCFFLPFVSISCQSTGFDISADYSGLDLLTNGEPSTTIPPELSNLSDGGPSTEEAPTTNAQLWAILTAVIVAAGLLTSLAAATRVRRMAAIAGAGLGIVLLVVTQIVAQGNLGDQMWAEASQELDSQDDIDLGGVFNFTEPMVRDMTGWEIGFLLALLLLLVVLLGNIAALTYPKWKRFVPTVRVEAAAAQPGAVPPGADLRTPPMGTPQQPDVPGDAPPNTSAETPPGGPSDTPPERPAES